MLIKNKLLFLFIISISGISCSGISNEELVGTKWTDNESSIYCDFTSENNIDIMYNKITNNYLFYIENDKIIITNKSNYSQYVIENKNGELFFDSEIVNSIPKTIIKLHKITVNIIQIKSSDLQTDKPVNLPVNQPADLHTNPPDTLPTNLTTSRPIYQPASLPDRQ